MRVKCIQYTVDSLLGGIRARLDIDVKLNTFAFSAQHSLVRIWICMNLHFVFKFRHASDGKMDKYKDFTKHIQAECKSMWEIETWSLCGKTQCEGKSITVESQLTTTLTERVPQSHYNLIFSGQARHAAIPLLYNTITKSQIGLPQKYYQLNSIPWVVIWFVSFYCTA